MENCCNDHRMIGLDVAAAIHRQYNRGLYVDDAGAAGVAAAAAAAVADDDDVAVAVAVVHAKFAAAVAEV